MRKSILLILSLVLLAQGVLAQVNLDFNLGIEDEVYLPNEEVKVNVSLLNRDTAFAARNVQLTIVIADRFYEFDLGDVEKGKKFQEMITLPQFPAGTHTVKGILNYTGLFDETFTIETYNAFEVAFPPIERYPRNVQVLGFNLPDKLIAGKSYDVSVVVNNGGDFAGGMIIEVASLDEFVRKETHLEPGESKTVDITIKFVNTDISLIEARVYAVINGVNYLLTYSGKKAYILAEKKAKLSFDRIEFVGESDNQINQNDEVKFKIFIKNEGDYSASNVVGTLTTPTSEIELLEPEVNYELIAAKESYAHPDNLFEIKTKDVGVEDYKLGLSVSYIDSEERSINFEVPISTNAGRDLCKIDDDCRENEKCGVNGQCVSIACPCGVVRNKECIPYECCSNSDCGEFENCNTNIKKCVTKTGCMNVLRNGNSNDKLDILIIGAEYQDYPDLKNEIISLMDINGNSKYTGFFTIEPFKSLKNKFNIWMIKAPDVRAKTTDCGASCGGAIDRQKISGYESVCPNLDQVIIIFKYSKFRSCAGGTHQWNSLSCQPENTRGKLILHESGHAIGKLADEYVEPSKGSRPWGPNCANTATEAQGMWGDLVGVQGVGFFEGCSYTDDNIRNMKNNIMRSHYSADSYGPVNERAIIKQLEVYK